MKEMRRESKRRTKFLNQENTELYDEEGEGVTKVNMFAQ